MTANASPPINTVARELAAGLPEDARAAGLTLLREQILPWELRNYRGHPNPDRLVALVVDELRRGLAEVDPLARPAVLESRALRAEVQRTAATAHDLALRRWAAEHGESQAALTRIADPAVAALTRDAVAAASVALLERLTVLEATARERATYERDRLELLHARIAAGSARTGDFSLAVGRLADELRALGDAPRDPRPH